MSSQFAVGYSAEAVQYNQGQAYYLIAGESASGDVIPGNLLVNGNLAVNGTTNLSGATAMQAATATSMGVTGQLSTTGLFLAAGAAGASVTGAGGLNVTAGAAVGGALTVGGPATATSLALGGAVIGANNIAVPGGSSQLLGNITCNSVLAAGGLTANGTIAAGAAIVANNPNPTASPFFGLQGTKVYNVVLAAGNNELGLAPIVNTGFSHVVMLQLQEAVPVTPGDAGFCAVLITIPANASEPPAILSNTIQGNGYAIAIVGPNPPGPFPGYRIQVAVDGGHVGTCAVSYTVLM